MASHAKVDSVVRWSPLRAEALDDPKSAERLRLAAKALENAMSDPGWQYVHEWIAREQAKALNYLLRSPGDDRADTYALKKAHAAGVADAFRHALETPKAVLEIARQVSEQQQRLAELAEQEGTR